MDRMLSKECYIGRFKFKRGNHSEAGDWLEYKISIDTKNVSYMRNAALQRVGWIPATEKLWDNSKISAFKNSAVIKLWGFITAESDSAGLINVYYETIPAKNSIEKYIEDNISGENPPKITTGYSLKDFTMEAWTHVPINAGNGLEITGNTISMKETMLQNLIETNKQAAQQAAYLEAGRLANVTLAGILAKKFPGLPQTPFNALVLANIADQVAKNLKPNPQLAKLTAAMTTQAFLELYAMVDLEGMIHELLSDDSVKAYLGSTE